MCIRDSVAAGRVDGFFEIGLRPWDFAAGELLVREAGGIVSDFTGCLLYTSEIIAAERGITAGRQHFKHAAT